MRRSAWALGLLTAALIALSVWGAASQAQTQAIFLGRDGRWTVAIPPAGNYTISCAAGPRIAVMSTSAGGASPTITLPKVSGCQWGTEVIVVSTTAPSAGAGLHVDANATDAIYGNDFLGAAGKGAINTLATQSPLCCDSITLLALPSINAWIVTGVIGTWAREP